ncbi:bifunctional hydroxymethylpyrimidine kinase/phosphomethylpyrimidine kinase [Anaerobacillus sp. HL2]|nr:bifunctional hydroxymethylpyrimidine kinase/phosphomethylpyrimidine kinase [Anaerobacillus sp. HL2]
MRYSFDRNGERNGKSCFKIHKLGPKYVVLKGGHLEESSSAIDILFDGDTRIITLKQVELIQFILMELGVHLQKGHAELAKDEPIGVVAVSIAKKFIQAAIEHSVIIAIGPTKHSALRETTLGHQDYHMKNGYFSLGKSYILRL